MTDEQIASGCTGVIRKAIAQSGPGTRRRFDPLREKLLSLRVEHADPNMSVKTMTGAVLEEFVDFTHQFLVEQTGFRATISADRSL